MPKTKETKKTMAPTKKTPVKAAAKAPTKSAPKAPIKAAPKSAATQAKAEKKGSKPSAKVVEIQAPAPGEEQVDLEELEEQAEIAAASTASAALSGAAPTAESSVSFKNFRHHPDMENFYRFIYENDLRFEALAIIDEVLAEKRNHKKLKVEKSKAH